MTWGRGWHGGDRTVGTVFDVSAAPHGVATVRRGRPPHRWHGAHRGVARANGAGYAVTWIAEFGVLIANRPSRTVDLLRGDAAQSLMWRLDVVLANFHYVLEDVSPIQECPAHW